MDLLSQTLDEMSTKEDPDMGYGPDSIKPNLINTSKSYFLISAISLSPNLSENFFERGLTFLKA